MGSTSNEKKQHLIYSNGIEVKTGDWFDVERKNVMSRACKINHPYGVNNRPHQIPQPKFINKPLIGYKLDLNHFKEFIKIYTSIRTIDGKFIFQSSYLQNDYYIDVNTSFMYLLHIYMLKYDLYVVEIPDTLFYLTVKVNDCYNFKISCDRKIIKNPIECFTLALSTGGMSRRRIIYIGNRSIYIDPKNMGLLAALGNHKNLYKPKDGWFGY
jgi:hypothetical protein